MSSPANTTSEQGATSGVTRALDAVIMRHDSFVFDSMVVMAMPDAHRYGIDNAQAPRAVELMAIADLVARLEPAMRHNHETGQQFRKGLGEQAARQLISMGASADPGQYYGPKMSKKERIARAQEKRERAQWEAEDQDRW